MAYPCRAAPTQARLQLAEVAVAAAVGAAAAHN
jgi:hypothetical protein